MVKQEVFQEIYNVVATHLLTQLAISQTSSGIRVLRDANGLKCALGILIKDDVYNIDLELYSFTDDTIQKAIRASGHDIDASENTTSFLRRLQEIHDRCPIDTWLVNLEDLSIGYNLDASVLDQFR